MKKIIDLYKKYEEIVNYIIVGGLTTFVSLATYYICVFTFLDPNNAFKLQIANVISWIFSVTFAYLTNRKYVFKSKNNEKLKEALKFYLSRVSTLLIDMFTMFLLVTVFAVNDKLSKILVQFIILVLNYLFSKFLVFSNKNVNTKTDKKKILFTTYDLNIGGIESCLVNLVNNFDHDKYDVTIILQKKEGDLLKFVDDRVKVIDYNLSKINITIIRKIINIFKIFKVRIKNYHKYDFSFCYGYGYKPSAILALLASKNNAVWMHTNIVEFIKNKDNITYLNVEYQIDKFLKNIKFRKFKKYFFVSQNAIDTYLTLYPNDIRKSILCYNFVDYKSIIEKSNEKVNDMYEKNEPTFISISRQTEFDKKLSRIIKAAAKLKNKYKFKIIMIGDGNDQQKYKNMVKDKKLEKNIIFYGKKANPFPYLKNADALVLSSKFEGFPTTFTEAMVLNVPIITTNVSDSLQVIKDKFGIVVNNNDEDIYNGMKKFLDEGFKIEKSFNGEEYNSQIYKKIYDIIEESD